MQLMRMLILAWIALYMPFEEGRAGTPKRLPSGAAVSGQFEILETRLAPVIRVVNLATDTAANGVIGELRSEMALAVTGDIVQINIPGVANHVIKLDNNLAEFFGFCLTTPNFTSKMAPM